MITLKGNTNALRKRGRPDRRRVHAAVQPPGTAVHRGIRTEVSGNSAAAARRPAVTGLAGPARRESRAGRQRPRFEDGPGRFHLIREIGRGGMGIVFEADQISLKRKVAVKVLPFAATLDRRQ